MMRTLSNVSVVGETERQRVLNITDIRETDFQFVCRRMGEEGEGGSPGGPGAECKHCRRSPCVLVWLCEVLGISADKERLLQSLLQEIQTSLRSAFPFCRVEPYGSFRTGFGLENCDLDLHLHISPSSTSLRLPNPHWASRAQTLLVAEVLRRNERFHSAAAITNTRIPIVKGGFTIHFKKFSINSKVH